ncbi:unnamed protein product [Phytophthora fragariaefolia]|uniref:Unnamed protein product n=1 Tax=Phytophthora fragariaefolia TaxID=1490495 RepID=A0A9W6UF86_9STRA|nr:unnamed protein product [Phytophthora fragariaefolia]
MIHRRTISSRRDGAFAATIKCRVQTVASLVAGTVKLLEAEASAPADVDDELAANGHVMVSLFSFKYAASLASVSFHQDSDSQTATQTQSSVPVQYTDGFLFPTVKVVSWQELHTESLGSQYVVFTSGK